MRKNQQGSALLLVIIVFATLFALLGISLERGFALFERIQKRHLENVAFNLAEAGVEYTLHQLVTTGEYFPGEGNVVLDPGTFSTLVVHLGNSELLEILSTGTAKGNSRTGEVVKTLRVLVQLSPDESDQPPIIHFWEEISQSM